jgi:tryptophanyl-tRNA synthetase
MSNTAKRSKILEEFGSQEITPELKEKLSEIASNKGLNLHPFFENGLFFSHRDLDVIINHYLADKPFYLYTGRGPSSESLHIGHLVPFIMTKYLQDLFNVPVIIQITDDEKFYNAENIKGQPKPTLEYYQKIAEENIKDIISIGFNPDKTYIIQNTRDIGLLYPTIVKINRVINLNQMQNVFGSTESDNMGKVSFPVNQIAPSFPQTFYELFNKDVNIGDIRVLILCAIDQDPYFRLTRDIASKLNYNKPSLIHSGFFPSLFGVEHKMSSSAKDINSVIFINETSKKVKEKINKYAFSGGKDTIEEHRELGGDIDVDICCQYLQYLLDDKPRYETIINGYREGSLLSGELKKITIDIINQILSEYQERRHNITKKDYLRFITKKILKFN